ncbi:hypothetical protein KKH82_02320, partial [Patescibacteria group bacterium]|nr:hypothetical protein [Patescibacteria group bacterium]
GIFTQKSIQRNPPFGVFFIIHNYCSLIFWYDYVENRQTYIFKFKYFIYMSDLKKREDKIKAKRMQTPWRDFVKEIGSWF